MIRRKALDLGLTTKDLTVPTAELQLGESITSKGLEALPVGIAYEAAPIWYIIGSSKGETHNGLVGYENIIYGLGGDDTLNGQENNDQLYGGTGNDILEGRLGNDVLSGDEGDDTMTGGPGDDTYGVDSHRDVVEELENEGTDVVASFLQSYTLSLWVENLILIDSALVTARQTGWGNQLDNRMEGNHKDNALFGRSGADFILGGAGNDYLDSGYDADHVHGGSGNDTLVNPGGSDVLYGEDGNDIFNNSANRGEIVFMFLGEGNNDARGSASDDYYIGSGGAGSNKYRIDGYSNWFGRDTIQFFNPAIDKLYIGRWFNYDWDNVIVRYDGLDLFLARDENNYVKLPGVTLQSLKQHNSVADLIE
jgi:Ca2+-binding RTX toxin-like protein